MINYWLVTGDTHGQMGRFEYLQNKYNPNETAVIILGDAGCNYYKSKKDILTKESLEKTGFYFYLIRGNHEDRPENIKGIIPIYDNEVSGEVFFKPSFPHIRYLKDGGIYNINNHRTLVIGGAYSIDKWYRLQMGYMWFPQEQLTKNEMIEIENKVDNQTFDFILTHTCPLSWEPIDLFIEGVDQSTVDKSMEIWLNKLKDKITWKIWLFGHYHADRLERPNVEMFYTKIENIEDIWDRWISKKEIDQSFIKSPNFNKSILY